MSKLGIVAALLLGALAFLPEDLRVLLAYDRTAMLNGELWRLWTAHAVHYSLTHAVVDITVLAVILTMARRTFNTQRLTMLLLVGAPVISLGLLALVPDMSQYMGCSALAYLLGTAVAIPTWRTQPASRPWLGAIAVMALLKLVWDAAAPATAASSLPAGVQIAWQAHAFGVVLAALEAFLRQRASAEGSCCQPSE